MLVFTTYDGQQLFRAQSPKVLRMKPFEPKKRQREPLEFNEILLHTEHRTKERKVFDVRMTEKENRLMELRHERDLIYRLKRRRRRTGTVTQTVLFFSLAYLAYGVSTS